MVKGDGIAFGRLCFDANGGVIDLYYQFYGFWVGVQLIEVEWIIGYANQKLVSFRFLIKV